MQYTVQVAITKLSRYHVDAESKYEAKELVMSGDYDPYESEEADIVSVEVLE